MVTVGDAKMGKEVVEFGQQQVDGPGLRPAVGQVGRAAVADLIVGDDGAPVLDQVRETVDVVVSAARPAMDHHDRGPPPEISRHAETVLSVGPRREASIRQLFDDERRR